jgi:hypothetical protein
MPIVLIILLGVPVAIFLLLSGFNWLIVPLILKRRHRQAAKPTYSHVTPEQLTPEARDFLGSMIREFATAGFEVAANVCHEKAVKGITSTSTLLVNRASGDVANVITTRGDKTRAMVYIIHSHFRDRTSISTAFNRGIGILPRDPNHDGLTISWTRDVAALAELHRRRVVRSGRGSEPRVTPAPGEEIRYMEEDWDRGMAHFVRVGYYRPDPNTGEMRSTFKGAYLMAWKLMQPVKSLRMRRRDRNARREWKALGMDQWQQTSPAPAPAMPGIAPGIAPVAHDGLGYESRLAVGEIRGEQTPTGLTVRVGMPTRAAAIGASWTTILSLLFFGGLVALTAYTSWVQYTMWMRFAPTLRPQRSLFGIWFYVLLLFLAFDVLKLVRILVWSRGTVVLAASPAGLAYQNIPAWSPSGMVSRDDIDTLLVKYVAGLFRKSYQLQLRRHASIKVLTLFSGRDKAAMENVRSDLAVALGIERADEGLESLREDAAAITAAARGVGGSPR